MFNLVKNSPNPTILLSEVFEHIEPNEAINLVNKIKLNIAFSKMIITAPDVGFNKYYSPNFDITGEINSRHPDHKYEYTQDEFTSIILKLFDDKYTKEFHNVGDKIDSNSITQSYIISPIN